MFGRTGKRRARRSGALTTAAVLLGVVTLTAGCAALGANGASVAGGAMTATRPASGRRPPPRRPSRARRPLRRWPGCPAAARPPPRLAGLRVVGLRVAGLCHPHSAAAPEPPPSGAAGSRRLVTFANQMSQTIWVAAAPNPSTPLAATGWVLPAGHSVTITTPNNLNTRFWGRTGCVFNGEGVGHCQTGDCGGLFQCKGWGTIPATLAEVNFDAWDGLDFYDVSMVDGSNLPMYINITKSSGGTKDKISPDGCVPAGCTKPVVCPSVLDVKVGGTVVGCISACARLDTDQLCCRGQWSSRAACNPAAWPVDYAAVFKRAEPYAYSYVDDDATSVFTCQDVCDYRITFGITP